jgi:hypothetical protein
MLLSKVRLAGVGPFDDAVLPFADDDGRPLGTVVIHGGGGVGKTTLLAAIAATRPGHAVALTSSQLGGSPSGPAERREPPRAVAEWWLGRDDPERPHPLRVGTPGARLASSDEEESFRRREQALFDKRAAGGGFAFLTLPANRWFSRQPVGLSAPARTVARYDVRGASSLDEAARADLTRETKQALAYAEIAASLAALGGDRGRRLDLLGRAMRSAVDALSSLAGFSYRGLDAASFEPVFADEEGRERPFDAMPTRARHLTAFAALAVRLLWAAYPREDPLESEGVVCIDEVDLHQDAATSAAVVPALSRALPKVQWIVTTSSALVASGVDAREVLALRRMPDLDRVELHLGDSARIH